MALIEEQIVITRKDADGNLRMQFPVTHKDYVEGLAEIEEAASKGGVPVGFEYFTTNPNIPVGSLPLIGGTYSRTAYADLWAWVQTQTGYLITEAEWQEKATANEGNVPFYSDGDGSATFRVPSLSCWVRGASGIEEVGSYLEAGLPNINGIFKVGHAGTVPEASGAFSSTSEYESKWGGTRDTSDSYTYTVTFDASLSNPIYGNSDTVQPPSIVGMWLVKAFGTVSNVGNQDIADVSAGLTRVEEKMDEYTDNVAYIDSFIVESWVSDDGLSWYRKYNDGYIEQAGDAQGTAKNEKKTITLPTAFTTTNYCVVGTLHGSGWDNDNGSFQVSDKTTTSFLATSSDAGAYYLGTWYACGY